MVSVSKVIKSFKEELKEIYPAQEISAIIELVLEYFLTFSKTDVILKTDFQLPDNKYNILISTLERLKNQEPIQYILGETFFYNFKFIVKPGVLIPRQETEELVDWIIKDNKYSRPIKILDIGTGSGCIAITLAANIDNSNVTAFDISEIALEIASENANMNKVSIGFDKVDILRFNEMPDNRQFDIIVSNPPYILEKEKKLMQKNVMDFEPSLALFVKDNDPLIFYKAIVKYAVNQLNTSGKLYFEINEAFGFQVEELLLKSGFESVQLKKDINGKFRMVSGIKNKK